MGHFYRLADHSNLHDRQLSARLGTFNAGPTRNQRPKPPDPVTIANEAFRRRLGRIDPTNIDTLEIDPSTIGPRILGDIAR